MTARALHELKVEVSSCEARREGPSYAIDTAREIAQVHKGSTLTWVVGSDAFAHVETWKDFEDLISLVDFLVIVRPGSTIDQNKVNKKIKWSALEIGALDISSTQVRSAIQHGDEFSTLVPPQVADYIKEKGLYGAA